MDVVTESLTLIDTLNPPKVHSIGQNRFLEKVVPMLANFAHYENDKGETVFGKQAVQECYVVLSHRSLPLFRTLEFVGSCSFNVWMAASSALSVIVYERLGMVAPFYMVAAFSGLWALVIVTFFCLRLRGLPFRQSFAISEHALLMQLQRSKADGLTLNELELPRT